jgi:hypothetical protein
MDYSNDKNYAVENKILQKCDIFDFIETPNEILYKRLYLFCRENINIQIERNTIPHGCFLFSTNFDVNAYACRKENSSYGIIISMGLIQYCIDKYLYNTGLNVFFEKNHPNLVQETDISLSYLIYQTNTLFTYYHELAHLFQFSKATIETELQERLNDNNNFDIVKHKLEINADTYAAICIATHIYQYINTGNFDFNQKNIDFIICLLSACLLDYIISFSNKSPLYYKKYSHPHSFIRMLNIILNITNHFSSILLFKEKGIKFDTIGLFKKIIDFHEFLIQNCGLENIIQTKNNSQNIDMTKMLSYIDEVTYFDCTNYIDALDIWNKYI